MHYRKALLMILDLNFHQTTKLGLALICSHSGNPDRQSQLQIKKLLQLPGALSGCRSKQRRQKRWDMVG